MTAIGSRVGEWKGRRYLAQKPQGAAGCAGATAVFLCAERESLEDVVKAWSLPVILSRHPCTSLLVVEGRAEGADTYWGGYGARQAGDPPGRDAEDIADILRSEGMLADTGELPRRNHSGELFVVAATSTAARAALHLLRLLSVGLLLIANPYFMRCMSNPDAALDSQPPGGATYVFVFSAAIGDKAALPFDGAAETSEPLSVFLWLLDASQNAAYSAWKPRGNAQLQTQVKGYVMTMASDSSCFTSSFTDVVLWYHSMVHVLELYLSKQVPKTGPSGKQKYSRARYAAAVGSGSFVASAIEAIASAADEGSGGGYPRA